MMQESLSKNSFLSETVVKSRRKKLTAAFLLGTTALVASAAIYACAGTTAQDDLRLSQEYLALYVNNKDGTCRILKNSVNGPAYINFGGVYHKLSDDNIENLFVPDLWIGTDFIAATQAGKDLDPNATLGRIPGESQVYLINGNTKRPIEDEETFNKCSFDANKIKESNEYKDLIPGPIIGLKGKRYPDGTYFRVGDKVKVILGGYIRDFAYAATYHDLTNNDYKLV
jgi:hypothetical protein